MMIGAFKAGYREAGAPPLHVFAGKVLGILTRTAAQTVVVVLTLRLMGVI